MFFLNSIVLLGQFFIIYFNISVNGIFVACKIFIYWLRVLSPTFLNFCLFQFLWERIVELFFCSFDSQRDCLLEALKKNTSQSLISLCFRTLQVWNILLFKTMSQHSKVYISHVKKNVTNHSCLPAYIIKYFTQLV